MDFATLTKAGWKKLEVGGFTGLAGPYWMRGQGAERESGILIEPRHCNNHMGTIHGGVIMTFADIGLGIGVAHALGGSNCVTVQLQTHFVSTAHSGEFVMCQQEVVRKTKQLIFVRGLIRTEEKIIASADGIWKVIDLEPNPKLDAAYRR